jgi:uncharacterized protein YndB with AHSA1/START domain
MKPDARDPLDSRHEIVNTREFPFPRRAVFEAFSDPRQLAQWWGPKGFTNTIREFDLRPGGAFLLTMQGPDGQKYELTKKFVEVVPAEKVVIQHLQEGHDFRLTMTFAEDAGRTTVTWRMRFESAEELEKIRGFLLDANEQNLARLAEHLAKTAK